MSPDARTGVVLAANLRGDPEPNLLKAAEELMCDVRKPLVHIGAMLMRTDPALALSGRRCLLDRLTDAGFEFTHPAFGSAVQNLLTPTAA